MANVETVAKFIIEIFTIKAEEGLDDGMTNLRLQKLLYFAQGFYLAEYGKPLYDEEIEAWKFGPVIPSIYSKYNRFNSSPIKDDPPAEDGLTQEEKDAVISVLSMFGRYSTGYLVSLSHKPDAPWAQVYDEKEKKTIDKSSIEEYFKKNRIIIASEKTIEKMIAAESEPRRGKNGYVLLPEEDYEDWEQYYDD